MIEVSIHYPTARRVYGHKEPLTGGLIRPEVDTVRVEFTLPKRPFLFWSDKLIQAEKIPLPKGYGVAYYDFPTAKVLMAPMPFNVLVGFTIWCYQWTRYGAVYWLVKHLPKHRTLGVKEG